MCISKYGTFVGRGYDYGGLFHLSLHDDACSKGVNNVLFLMSQIFGIHGFVMLILVVYRG
jgi:hypothetical protein